MYSYPGDVASDDQAHLHLVLCSLTSNTPPLRLRSGVRILGLGHWLKGPLSIFGTCRSEAPEVPDTKLTSHWIKRGKVLGVGTSVLSVSGERLRWLVWSF